MNIGDSCEEAVDLYHQQIQQLPYPEESWFTAALADYRARHDDASLRELCGGSLRQTLSEAEEFCRHYRNVGLLDAVQVANTALVDTVRTYTGGSLADYQDYLHQMVQMRLYCSLPPPEHNEQENSERPA